MKGPPVEPAWVMPRAQNQKAQRTDKRWVSLTTIPRLVTHQHPPRACSLGLFGLGPRACCLWGILSPWAGCLQGRLSWGILSPRRFISELDFLGAHYLGAHCLGEPSPPTKICLTAGSQETQAPSLYSEVGLGKKRRRTSF